MAIFKPSNCSLSGSTVDANVSNAFSIRANSSGEPIIGYGITIIDSKTRDEVFKTGYVTLDEPVKNKGYLELEIPANTLNNNKAYELVVRMYNESKGETNNYNSLVTRGMLVGSEKTYLLMRVPKDETFKDMISTSVQYVSGRTYVTPEIRLREITKYVNNNYSDYSSLMRQAVITFLINYLNGKVENLEGEIELLVDDRQKEVFDHIKYDMFVQLDLKSSEYKDRLIITPDEAKGNDKDYPLKLPATAEWSERTKVDWVTNKLGPEKDWIIIELTQSEIDDETKGFTYHPTDGTEFSLYQVSGLTTTTQFFVDPGVTQNIKVGDYVLIYATAEDAMAAREAGDNPGSASFKVAPVFPNAKKVIGISSDTGSIRLGSPLESAPKVGMVPRFFKYSGVDDIYTEEVVGDKTAGQSYHVTASSYYFAPTGTIPTGTVPVSYTDTQLTTPAPSNDLLVNPEDFPSYNYEGALYSTKVPTFVKESEHIYKAKKAEFVDIYKEPQHVCRVYVDANETITLPEDLVYPVKCVAKTYNGVKHVVKTVDTTENIIQHWNFTKEGHEIAYKKISAENGKFAYFTKDYTLYAPEIKELGGIIEENFYWEEEPEKVEFSAANADALKTWVRSQLTPVVTIREAVAPTEGERVLKFGDGTTSNPNYIQGGVQTYYDSALKYKKGITGPQYTVLSAEVSKVSIYDGSLSQPFKTLYIATPKTFNVYAHTPYYSDENCTQLVGYTPANTTLKGNFLTIVKSTITVSGGTYYIKTPKTGVAEQNTPLFKDSAFTEKAGFVSPADSISAFTPDSSVYSTIKEGSPFVVATSKSALGTAKLWVEGDTLKTSHIGDSVGSSTDPVLDSTVDGQYYYFLTAKNIYVYSDSALVKKIANSNNFKFLTYGAGKFVGLCENGTYGYSTDCESWITKSMPQQYTVQFNGYTVEDSLVAISNYNNLYYGNGYFVATSRHGMYVMTSIDGISWTKVAAYRRWYGNENLSFYADEIVDADHWEEALSVYKTVMHTACFNFSCIMYSPTDEFVFAVESSTQGPTSKTAYMYSSNPMNKFYFESWVGETSFSVKKMYKQGSNLGLLSETNVVSWITAGGTSIKDVEKYANCDTLAHFGTVTTFTGTDGITYKDNGKTEIAAGYDYVAEFNNTAYIATPKLSGININLPKTTYLKTGATASYKGWRMSQLDDGRYVPTPINTYNGVPNYTKLYADKALKAMAGVSAMQYYMVTDKLAWTELGYMQTPQTGTVAGVSVYSDPELTSCTGVVAATYAKVNETTVSFELNGTTYYAKSPQAGYAFAGTKLYNDANLTDYYGVLEGKEDYWVWTDKNNEASCRCTTSEGVKYIEKPSTGFLVQNNTPYYQEDTLTTLAGTYNITSTTYTIKDKWVSTISLDGQIAYVHTPDHGAVPNGTIIYSDTELSNAVYTVNENTIYKDRAKTRTAMVINVEGLPELWSSSKAYKVNDLVIYLNSTDAIPYVYKATSAHVGSAPEEGMNWVKVNDYITYSGKITSNGEGKPYDTANNETTTCYWIAYVGGKNYYIDAPTMVNIYDNCYTYGAIMDPANNTTGQINAGSYLVPVEAFKTDKDLLICNTPEGRYYVCIKDKHLITSSANADEWWLGAYKGDAELSGRIYKGTYTYNDALSSLITYGSQIYYIQSPIAGMVYKEMPCQPILFNGEECTEATITIDGKTYIVNSLNGTIEKDTAGGKSASIEAYQQQAIGGNPVKIIEPYNIIISNVDGERIFVQPNLNIKTDKTNPPQLIFDNDARMDILQKMDGSRDITFVKISDAVWMLESDAMRMVRGAIPVDGNQHIYPTCPYEVWTCLMDQMPSSIFNTKTTADMNILAIDLYQGETYTNITNKPTYAYRDIGFKTEVNFAQGENMQVNYYRYILYRDGELLEESETFYSNDLTWEFKGLISDPEIEYEIECIVTDNYGKTLTIKRPFKIEYSIEEDEFVNFEFDCDLRANKLTIIGDGINECVYTIYRKSPKELTYTFLKSITTAEGFDFVDSNIASGEYYIYNVIKDDPTLEGYKQWMLEDYVTANFEGWLMQDLIKQEDGTYATDDDLWKYTYAISSGAITQNIGSGFNDSLSRYGKVTYSDKNYASGTLTALLGEVKHYKVLPTGILDTGHRVNYTERMGTSEYDTEVDKLKKWKKFITNGNYKILKNPKGEVFIIAITASPTYDNHDTSNLKQTTITINWTEIMDQSKTLVLNTIAAKAPVVMALDRPYKIGFIKDGVLGWYGDGKFQYSYDRYTWTDWDGKDYIEAQQIDNLFELSIRGVDNSTFNDSTMVIIGDGIDGQVTLGGDISALLDNFHTTKQAPGAYAHLFEGCNAIGDASNLKLADDVLSGDYAYMFKDCINLTKAPNIPSDTANRSYEHMFEGCTQLNETPNLPATNISDGCYSYMFANTGVTATSALPGTVLAPQCYEGMFKNCRSLTEIKPISGSVMADSCYKEMFSNCTELIAGTPLNSVSMEPHCYEEMFNGCYKIKDPIVLPADKLALDCYKKMFYGCTAIKFSTDGGVYRLPDKGTSVYGGSFADQMFFGCTGYDTINETGTPLVNTDYHVEQQYVKFSSETPLGLFTMVIKDNGAGATDFTQEWFGDGTAEYSYDNINWKPWNGEPINGNPIYLRGIGNTTLQPHLNLITNEPMQMGGLGVTGDSIVKIEGDLNALLDYEHMDSISYGKYAFTYLFGMIGAMSQYMQFDQTLAELDVTNLTLRAAVAEAHYTATFSYMKLNGLPKMTMSDTVPAQGYQSMFAGSNITEVPALPATTIGFAGYQGMFAGCTELVEAPALPATNLEENCYDSMLMGTKITKAPVLPATNVPAYAYQNMFESCSYLKKCPELPATTLGEACYREMFKSCKALELPCELPATNIPNYAYEEMFKNCTGIKFATSGKEYRVPVTGTGSVGTDSLKNMFDGCLGTAPSTPVVNTTYYIDYYEPLTFSSNYTFTVGLVDGWKGGGDIYWSTDKTNWVPWTGTTVLTPALVSGKYTLYLRGENNSALGAETKAASTRFQILEGRPDVSGFVSTLIDHDRAANDVIQSYGYAWLFADCSLGSISGLKLNNVGNGTICSYYRMFINSTITNLPVFGIPKGEAYMEAFANCTQIKSVDVELPLGDDTGNYKYAFKGSGITEVKSTIFTGEEVDFGYSYMFSGCEELTTIPSLPKMTSGKQNVFTSMYEGCTSLSEAPDYFFPADSSLGKEGYARIFKDCSALEACPNCPVMELSEGLFAYAFENCSSLKQGMNFAPIDNKNGALNVFSYMFSGCDSITTPTTPKWAVVPEGAYCGMYLNCSKITAPPVFDYLQQVGTNGMKYMFGGCEKIEWGMVGTEYVITPPSSTGTNAFKDMFTGTTNDELVDNGTPEPGITYFLQIPLYFESTTAFSVTPPDVDGTLLCSTDYDNWVEFTNTKSAIMTDGTYKLYVKGSNNHYCNRFIFPTGNNISVVGPIVNLLGTKEETWNDGVFAELFMGEDIDNLSKISNVTGLIMPKSVVGKGAFRSMFAYSKITYPPTMGYETITEGCFESMFEGSLLNATIPAMLPAAVMQKNCYKNMFRYSHVSDIPYLLDSVTTLAEGCFEGMFAYSGVQNPPHLTIKTLKDKCYKEMFKGCNKLIYYPTMPKLAELTTQYACCHSMFQGCSGLTFQFDENFIDGTIEMDAFAQMYDHTGVTKVDLAINNCVVKEQAFYGMFSYSSVKEGTFNVDGLHSGTSIYHSIFCGCANLTKMEGNVHVSNKDFMVAYAFDGCKKLTTVPNFTGTYKGIGEFMSTFSNTAITSAGCINWDDITEVGDTTFASTFLGCTLLTSVPDKLPKPAANSYRYMFQGCTSLTMAPDFEEDFETAYSKCCMNMYTGCTNLRVAPAIPATIMEQECFSGMFRDCTSLTRPAEMPQSTVLAPKCYENMYYGCTGIEWSHDSNEIFELSTTATVANPATYANGMFFGNTRLKDTTMPANGTPNFNETYYFKFIPFWFETTDGKPFQLKLRDNEWKGDGYLKYSLDEGETWMEWDYQPITGAKIYIQGVNVTRTTRGEGQGSADCSIFSANLGTSSPSLKVCGNIRGLVHDLDPNSTKACAQLFFNMTDLVSAGDLMMHDKLAPYCYYDMFAFCIYLKNPPVLPAKVLVEHCYDHMFEQSVGQYAEGGLLPPILPATALAPNCYESMFFASYLKTPPVLPATTLESACYRRMFQSCRQLTTAPVLPATIMVNNCYSIMFSGCEKLAADLTNLLPSTQLAVQCYYCMFENCTALTKPPVLPATTLSEACYNGMFDGCTSLTEAPNLPATVITQSAYQDMFSGCTALVDGDILNHNITTVGETGCASMFKGCAALTKLPILSATTLGNWSYARMFQDCTSINTIPELPATTLPIRCYQEMFSGCTKIIWGPFGTEWKVTGTDGGSATQNMFQNCTILDNADMPQTGTPVVNTTYHLLDVNGYVTFTSQSTFSVGVKTMGSCIDSTNYLVSTNGTDWSAMTPNGSNEAAKLQANGRYEVYMCAGPRTITNKINDTNGSSIRFVSGTGTIKIIGDAKNLSGGTNDVQGMFSCPADSTEFNTLIDATELVLSANNAAYKCAYMFSGCTKMYTSGLPSLSATTLVEHCYEGMFMHCKRLTIPPELPATTLKNSCYYTMFRNCTELVYTPELPAMTLADWCYGFMFHSCTKLTNVRPLPATTLAGWCYSAMFNRCTKLTTAPALPATTLTDNCYDSMFYGCSSLTQTPALPATNLANSCYSAMFGYCVSLTSTPTLPATTMKTKCYANMFNGCTGLTAPAALPGTTFAEYCYNKMFQNCTGIIWSNKGTKYRIPPSDYAYSSATGMFDEMFKGCNFLPNASMPTTGTPSRNTEYWYNGGYVTFEAPKTNWGAFTLTFSDEFKYSVPGSATWTQGATGGTSVTATEAPDGKYKIYAIASGTKTSTPASRVPISGTQPNPGTTPTVTIKGDLVDLCGTSYVNGYAQRLFYNNQILKDASGLIFPTNNCNYMYKQMFYNGRLEVAPKKLPATYANLHMYYEMFYNGRFTEAPVIEVTSMDTSYSSGQTDCGSNFAYMFEGCSNLTKAPELKCNYTGYCCYQAMFRNCSSLVDPPVMHLVNGRPSGWAFNNDMADMFFNCTSLTSAPQLPQTRLSAGMYRDMFYNCRSLVSPPALPSSASYDSQVSTEYGGVFESMFKNCTSLTTTPTIPMVSSSNKNTYREMFSGCESLTTIVPSSFTFSTIGEEGCYYMFGNCKSLVTAPSLRVTSMGDDGMYKMFLGCTSLTTPPSNLNMSTITKNGCYGMFSGCTNLATAPTIKASTIKAKGCTQMFYQCSSLVTAPALPATTLEDYCYDQMFVSCGSLTTPPPKLPATVVPQYGYRQMFGECGLLTSAPVISANTIKTYGCWNMFGACRSLTTPPALPATTLDTYCYVGMFNNCSGLTSLPVLPATTFPSYCYQQMFGGCTGIKWISSGGTAYRVPSTGTGSTPASNAFKDMFVGNGGNPPEGTGTPVVNTTYYYTNE